MVDLRFGRHAFGVCVAVAVLAGCGGTQPPVGAYSTSGTTQVVPHESTFEYTGSKQSFKVPAGVTQITVDASGAAGGSGNGLRQRLVGRGALGGRVRATIAVTPKRTWQSSWEAAAEHSGYNGGGEGASKGYGDGGGASDVRKGGDTLADRVIVAAGGGGGGGEGVYCGNKNCHHGDRGGNGGGGGRDGAAGGDAFGAGGEVAGTNMTAATAGTTATPSTIATASKAHSATVARRPTGRAARRAVAAVGAISAAAAAEQAATYMSEAAVVLRPAAVEAAVRPSRRVVRST